MILFGPAIRHLLTFAYATIARRTFNTGPPPMPTKAMAR